MSLSGSKFSHLPQELQVKILSFLLPQTPRSIETSLLSVIFLSEALPNHLLDVANTSCDLRKVVTEVLAARAQTLTASTSKPLWKWISALRDTVNAVSLNSDFDLATQIKRKYKYVEQDLLCYTSSLNIFRALSDHQIRLQVLDVMSAPFHLYNRPDNSAELLYGFKRVLETCSSSLRELAIRVTPVCLKAVSQVTLPNLQIVWLRMIAEDREPMEEFHGSFSQEKADFDYEFMHALRALEGHADRMANKTTLRELHFKYLLKPPCIHNDNTCSGLFEAVQVLQLGTVVVEDDKGEEFAKFVALFTNLRSLEWFGNTMVQNLPMIFASCPMLEHVYPMHYAGTKVSEWIKLSGPDSHTFRDACLPYRGKLRVFYLRSLLTTNQLQVLGENFPGLEGLDMYLNRENMAGLSCILGKYCRSLKKLRIFPRAKEVVAGDDNYEILGPDDWGSLSQSVRSASNQLCEVMVIGAEFNNEPHYKEMVQFALDVLEFLGERALTFCLNSQIGADSLEVIHDLVCTIINKCVAHSGKLRRLEVKLNHSWAAFLNDENESFWCAKLLYAMKQLENLPHLHKIDMGGREDFARKLLEPVNG